MYAGSQHTLRRLFSLGNHLKKVGAVHLSTSCPNIEVSSQRALIDEKVKITVSGLSRGQRVTLQTYLEEANKSYGACGHYVADCNGTVNTFRDPSYGGTFEGVEPMGLFWSMKTTPGVKPGRLIKSDVMKPYHVTLALQDGFRHFDELQWSRNLSCLASYDHYRTYTGPGVRRIPVSQNGIYGTLFVPAGDGPFPAVIDIFGITGGIIEFRSALLASRGIASFCIAYVNHEDLPEDNFSLDLHYFLKAFDWLAAHPLVDSNALGGVATCVGGGYLQLIASMRPAMKCMASVNSTGIPSGPEQTVEGVHLKPLWFHLERIVEVEGMVSLRKLFQPEDEVTVCPGWQHGAKLLSIQSLDDQCINPSYLEVFKSYIPQEFLKNCTFITYPGAGHLLEPPYTPLCRTNFNTIFEVSLIWGGHPKLHADAQEDSWPKIVKFLQENLCSSQAISSSVQT